MLNYMIGQKRVHVVLPLSTWQQCVTWNHQQHRVDFDETVCGWLPCDCTVDFTTNKDCREGHNDQGRNLNNSVGKHQLLHPAAMDMLVDCSCDIYMAGRQGKPDF